MMLAAAGAPLTADAATKGKALNVNCIKPGVIVMNGNCDQLSDIKDMILQGLPGCPVLPQLPGQPQQPGTPEKPNTPEDSVKPEQPETPGTPDSSEKSYIKRVVELVNIERAKEGLKALTIETGLEQAALVRAGEIQKSFSHTRPNGKGFGTAIREAGISYRNAGENIAWGQKTPEEVVKAWMNSPSHRANIMKKNFAKIGVAHVQNSAGTSYWVQLFTN